MHMYVPILNLCVTICTAVFAAFFEQTSYTVSETAGTLSVCLQHDIELGATIQSGVTVEVYLIEVSDQLLGMYVNIACVVQYTILTFMSNISFFVT